MPLRTPLCDLLGIDHPIVGFTPSEQVAAAISRAGGLGVLGAVRYNDADELEAALTWLDVNTGGRPYGVDVVMPAKVPAEGSQVDLSQLIPAGHRDFVDETLRRLGVPPLPADGEQRDGVLGWLHSVARAHVEVALNHPVALIANALGSPPDDVIAAAHAGGIAVAALAGKAEHAASHVSRGVDIVVAQGYEAGGHTGEIATMVLVPEVVDAVGADVPVLAAGGIGSGRQMAAAMALGAQGVWTGSIWLTVIENETGPVVTEKLLAAASTDTVRSRALTGKPARQLRTGWTDAWEAPDSPGPLPMPLQFILNSYANRKMGPKPPRELVGMPVGQIVSRMNSVRTSKQVVFEMVEEYIDVTQKLAADLEG